MIYFIQIACLGQYAFRYEAKVKYKQKQTETETERNDPRRVVKYFYFRDTVISFSSSSFYGAQFIFYHLSWPLTQRAGRQPRPAKRRGMQTSYSLRRMFSYVLSVCVSSSVIPCLTTFYSDAKSFK